MSNSYHSLLLSAFSPHPDVTLLRLEAPSLVQRIVPGQFVMAKLAGSGWDPFVREPLFVAGKDVKGAALTLWVPSGSEIRERIRQLPLHAGLDLLGPYGSGFTTSRQWRQLLLVAEGLAIGPLLAVAEAALAAAQSVTLLSVTPANQLPYPSEALPVSIEYQRASRGSASGIAQDMLRWADGVVAAGSQRFYDDLVDELRQARPAGRSGFAYGFLLEPFGWQRDTMSWQTSKVACAQAACRACLVELRRQKVLACQYGPLFDLWSL